MDTYEEALQYIKECTKFGMKLGLDRIREILRRLGHPEQRFRSIHIAGTNGKGSTSALLDSILRQAGYRTGRYNSPHLVTYRERFNVNGEMIAKAQLAQVIEQIKPVLEAVEADGFGAPTEFEVGTAIAFQHFANEAVDVAVVEVGMGGRFDATNVLTPVLSVITHIALDHQEYLGDTLEKIAFEKAGIIKENIPVVVGVQEESVRNFLINIAADRHAPCLAVDEGQLESVTLTEEGTRIRLVNPTYGRLEFQLALHGYHQAHNALGVIAGCEMLNRSGVTVGREVLIAGLESARWPSRFERIPTARPLKLYLDGTHNPDGAKALVQTVKTLYPGQKVDLLMGMLNNRPMDEMAGILGEIVRRVITTRVPDPKSASEVELGQEFDKLGIPVTVEPDPAKALAKLLETDNPVAVITGSFYLSGLLRGILLNIGD